MNLLLTLSSPYFIRVTRILERKHKFVTLDYEYVPDSLAKNQKIGDHAFLSTIRSKLVELCQILS